MKTSWGDEYSISFYEVDAMLYQSRQKTLQELPPVFLQHASREGEGKELCRARTGQERVNYYERDISKRKRRPFHRYSYKNNKIEHQQQIARHKGVVIRMLWHLL